jgi:hypothetical protein
VCSETHETWDGSLSDVGMCECQNGHVFCIDHKLNNAEANEDYQIPATACPICQLKHIPDYMITTYLRARLKINKEDVLKDIKHTFGTYEKFQKFIESQ